MDIQHTGKDILSDALRAYAEEKFSKACQQLNNFGGVRLHLTYDHNGHSKHGDTLRISAVLFLPGHEPLKAEESSDDLYGAVDLAAKEIGRQVSRYREKTYQRGRGEKGTFPE